MRLYRLSDVTDHDIYGLLPSLLQAEQRNEKIQSWLR